MFSESVHSLINLFKYLRQQRNNKKIGIYISIHKKMPIHEWPIAPFSSKKTAYYALKFIRSDNRQKTPQKTSQEAFISPF